MRRLDVAAMSCAFSPMARVACDWWEALAVETHENWLEQHRYLNMDDLREYKKETLRRAA
jgi:putative transposase